MNNTTFEIPKDTEVLEINISAIKNKIRDDVIDEVIEMMVNDHGYHPLAVVINDIRKLKESKSNKEININISNPISFGNQIKINKLKEQK